MKKNAVFCIAKDRHQAETIVDDLKSAGFPSTDISVLLPDKSGTRDFAHEQNTKMPVGATTGVVAGMSTGAILGWLAGIGTLAIPGVGPFIAAGPIMAAPRWRGRWWRFRRDYWCFGGHGHTGV